MVKLKGSVSFNEADLACLCKSVLPNSCQPLISSKGHVRKLLGIEAPILFETVIENLKLICKHVNGYVRFKALNVDISSELSTIIEAHYACLSKMKPPLDALHELKDVNCILLPSKCSLLQLVKPSQLVMQLPSGCSLEPYCYRVEPSLQKHGEFLMAVGVRRELKAQDYVNILASIKSELEGNVGGHDRENKVIEMVYREVIRCLRQGDVLTVNIDSVFLPDESMNLTKVCELCLNDAQWYRCRLPPDCGCRIILQPPVDHEGHCTLPKVLKVKHLSEIVTEELHESCKSSDVVCIDEHLFAVGKRPMNERCVFVQNILTTLKSDELFHGFCRLYFAEYGHHPTKSYMQLVKKLKEVKVQCIATDLRTVLHVNGKVIQGTEDLGKFCHLCKENGATVLHIAPHNKKLQTDMPLFFKDLALCISKVINNMIRNPIPIAAIFECEPYEIPQTLTRERITEYSVDNDKFATTISMGSSVSWNKLTPQDSLIILNFDVGEPVYCLCDDGSLINAEIVKCVRTNQEALLEFLEPTLTIKVSEHEGDEQESSNDGSSDEHSGQESDSNGEDNGDAIGNDNDSDNNNSDNNSDSDSDHSDDEDSDVTVNSGDDGDNQETPASLNNVCPIQVFKLLTVPQRKALWKGGTSPFACPVVLPTIPLDDPAVLDQWLYDVYSSKALHSCSGRTLEVFNFRLLRHVHFQLLVQRNEALLFKRLVSRLMLKIQDLAQKELPYNRFLNNKSEDKEVVDLLTKLMEKLTLEEVTTVSEQSDGGNSRSAQSELSAQHYLSTPKHDHRVCAKMHSTPHYQSYIKSTPTQAGRSLQQDSKSRQSVHTSSKHSTAPSRSQGVASRSWGVASSASQGTYQYPRFQRSWFQSATYSAPQSAKRPLPKICMKSATAWLEQAKADFNAALSLLELPLSCAPSSLAIKALGQAPPSSPGSDQNPEPPLSSSPSSDVVERKCKFPALVCFLCHDTVEKCIKGIHYAFCGLSQNLIDCSNLMILCNTLESSPHCPTALLDSIKECVMSVNRHENRSRFPNYWNPPCAPAAIYDVEDAREAIVATEKLLCKLQSEEKFRKVLENLGQLPPQRFMSSLKSMSVNQEYPDNWDAMEQKDEVTLFPLDPVAESEEYERIVSQFLLTLPNAEILRVERVQNRILWRKYYHCSQLMRDFDNSFPWITRKSSRTYIQGR